MSPISKIHQSPSAYAECPARVERVKMRISNNGHNPKFIITYLIETRHTKFAQFALNAQKKFLKTGAFCVMFPALTQFY